MVVHALARHDPASPRPRFLVADWIATLPFAAPALTRLGGVRACRENADRLLRTRRSVVAFPEGVKGAAKVFRERYRLQRFGRGGVVRIALDDGRAAGSRRRRRRRGGAPGALQGGDAGALGRVFRSCR